MKRATFSLVKAKACNLFVCMLLLCIRIYLKSGLRYTFLILVTYNPDILYLHEQGCEDPWLFCEAKRGPRAKGLDATWNCCLAFQVVTFRKVSLQTGKKKKMVAFQLDDWPAKDWDRFQAHSHRYEKRWLSSSCLPSVRMCQLGLHWTDFREIWHWPLLLHSVEQSYIWLKSYKNVGLFKWRPKCIIIVVEIFCSSTTRQNNALLNINYSCFNVYVFDKTCIACKLGLCASVFN